MIVACCTLLYWAVDFEITQHNVQHVKARPKRVAKSGKGEPFCSECYEDIDRIVERHRERNNRYTNIKSFQRLCTGSIFIGLGQCGVVAYAPLASVATLKKDGKT